MADTKDWVAEEAYNIETERRLDKEMETKFRAGLRIRVVDQEVEEAYNIETERKLAKEMETKFRAGLRIGVVDQEVEAVTKPSWADVVRRVSSKKQKAAAEGKEVMSKGETAHKSEAEALLKKEREERIRKHQVAHKPEAVAKEAVRKQREQRMKEREESRKSEAAERAAGMKKRDVAKKTEAAEGAAVMKKKQEAEAAESAVVMKKQEAAAKTSEAAENAAVMKKREVAKKTEAAEGAAVMKKKQDLEAAESAVVMKKQEEAAKKSEVVGSAAVRKRNKGKRFLIEAEKRKLMLEEIKKKNAENCNTEEIMDPLGYQARFFKKWWEETFGGNFCDTTCRFIANSESGAQRYASMQIISIKVSELTGGLQWPLDVYGLIAVRDSYDRKRNIIFERVRENCQTLTLEDPYLVLTGPMRAVMVFDPVFFEVSLYVRGTDNSNDRELNLLGVRIWANYSRRASELFKRSYTSRLSTIDFNLACINRSLEATISVNVISGPSKGFFGEFVAFNADVQDRMVLHKSGDKEVHFTGDEIHLSRSLLSVGIATKLQVSVTASDGVLTSSGSVSLDPLEKGGTSFAHIFVAGVCKLKVTVVWSPFPELFA